MFDVSRILAIPDESVDYLQMGISGGERAALKDRGFVRVDGTKAKDYMIRTIQKTAKNKAKAEKAIIKGDKPLAEAPDKKALKERLRQIESEMTPQGAGMSPVRQKPLVVSNPDRYESLKKEAKEINKSLGNKKREFYESTQDQASRLLRMPAARHKKYVEDALKSGKTVPDEVLKDYPDLSKKYSNPTAKGLAVTYNKKGDLSEGVAAKKIKSAIATASATPKSRKVVKGTSPRDRGIPPAASQFIKENSKNHTVFYNGKAVSMDYLGKKPKDEFKFAGMRIADNLSTGGVGFIKTPKGEYYQVSGANRSAKKVSEKEVLDSVRQSRPKQQSAAQKMNMTDAEYAAFKKKVARL